MCFYWTAFLYWTVFCTGTTWKYSLSAFLIDNIFNQAGLFNNIETEKHFGMEVSNGSFKWKFQSTSNKSNNGLLTLVQISVSGLHCKISLTIVAFPFSTAQYKAVLLSYNDIHSTFDYPELHFEYLHKPCETWLLFNLLYQSDTANRRAQWMRILTDITRIPVLKCHCSR